MMQSYSRRVLATAVLLLAGTLALGQAKPSAPHVTKPDVNRQQHDHSHQHDHQHAKPGPLIDQGESPDLLLLYTGDVIGYLDPCG